MGMNEFLKEDIGFGDITTEAIIPKGINIEAEIIAKEKGILAGIEEVKRILSYFNLKYKSYFDDGDEINKDDVIMKISGDARSILKIERTLLNILMRMSGIATLTRKLVKKARGVKIAGTRKTTPGFRYFEKKAIEIGGGDPHRYNLSDCILIKDNHIAIVGLEEAIIRAKKASFTKKIEIEVSDVEDAIKACELGVDIVMLDNLSPDKVKEVLDELKKRNLREKVIVEISGGITLENIEEYAKLKPDVISLGYLTTNSKWLDMSLKLTNPVSK